MNYTPSQIKNLMRRGLRLLIDPEPKKDAKKSVRYFFKDECAYCGRQIEDGAYDIDHLVSAAMGGANALANRVLSCKNCNAKEKRDRNWIEFLKEKCSSENIFDKRKSRIMQWIKINGGRPALDSEILSLLQQEADRTTKEYDTACARIRNHSQQIDITYRL